MQPLFVNTPCSTKIWLQDLKPSTVLSKYNDNHYFKLFMCTIKWGNFGHFLTCLFIFQRRYSCYWNYLEPKMGAGLICNHMLKMICKTLMSMPVFNKISGWPKLPRVGVTLATYDIFLFLPMTAHQLCNFGHRNTYSFIPEFM